MTFREPKTLALVLVVGVSPFATDTYIASLPAVRSSLNTSSGVAQLTITAFLLGLAVGQLVCGPVSDGRGRRRMLIASSVAFAVLSLVCAVAPSAVLLVVARALQGFAGGCGAAVGRAVISDRYTGLDAAARYGTLMSVSLLGPIIAPSVGGLILLVGDWRSVFVFLTALGVLMTAGVLIGIPETLPPQRRHPGGLANTARRMGMLIGRPAFVRVVAVQCFATAGFFTYIGGSSIVLQDEFGLSPTRYTVIFATNACAMLSASITFRLLVRRVGPRLLRRVGLGLSSTATLLLAVYALATNPDPALGPVWVLLALAVAGMGLLIPSTTAIAQEIGRDAGGTASALQGGLVFGVGALATPLTGLLGLSTVLGMGLIMVTLFACAVALHLFDEAAVRRDATRDQASAPPLDDAAGVSVAEPAGSSSASSAPSVEPS